MTKRDSLRRGFKDRAVRLGAASGPTRRHRGDLAFGPSTLVRCRGRSRDRIAVMSDQDRKQITPRGVLDVHRRHLVIGAACRPRVDVVLIRDVQDEGL
jgi:hypothetical protein